MLSGGLPASRCMSTGCTPSIMLLLWPATRCAARDALLRRPHKPSKTTLATARSCLQAAAGQAHAERAMIVIAAKAARPSLRAASVLLHVLRADAEERKAHSRVC